MTREDVFKHIKEKYGTEPEYLWFKTPDNAIFRYGVNKKWYGVVLTVEKSKLGIKGEGKVDLLNVKCDPQWRYVFCQEAEILPAYHMNKEHWVSIILGGGLSQEKILSLLDYSYEQVKGKR